MAGRDDKDQILFCHRNAEQPLIQGGMGGKDQVEMPGLQPFYQFPGDSCVKSKMDFSILLGF